MNSPDLALSVSVNINCDWYVVGEMGCVCMCLWVCVLWGRVDRAMTLTSEQSIVMIRSYGGSIEKGLA